MPKNMLMDPGWQALQANLLHPVDDDPGINVKLLREYLGNFSDPVKIRRVTNFLTSTRFLSRDNQIEICELLRDIRSKKEAGISPG